MADWVTVTALLSRRKDGVTSGLLHESFHSLKMVEQHPEHPSNERLPSNRRNYGNRKSGISDRE